MERIEMRKLALLFGVVSALAYGCIEREGRPVNPCTQVTISREIQVNNVDKVDLLFMIDNSNSMIQEQVGVRDQLPRMIRILTSGDFDQNGSTADPEDFVPVQDLNVAVITSDMGVGGIAGLPGCANADFGDDGLLRTDGDTTDGTCQATYPAFLNFIAGSGNVDAFGHDVGCVAVAGTSGCNFEQQLEAILKGLSPTNPQPWTAPSYVVPGTPGAPTGLDLPFFMSTAPHGDTENAGFLRQDAVLAIIPLTDEDDCSAVDNDLFNIGSTVYTDNINIRCATTEGALYPVERYVNGFLQLRQRPGLLIYAPITGISDALVPVAAAGDWATLVSPDPGVRDDTMEVVPDSSGASLVPSCEAGANGRAFPPVRIVQVAQGLQAAGAHVTVQSICHLDASGAPDYTGALTEIIRQIKNALVAACLPRQLNVQANGSVDCNVVAIMPTGIDNCDSYPGAVQQTDPPTEDGHPICVLPQLIPDSRSPGTSFHLIDGSAAATGWFYDTFTAEGATNCQDAAGGLYQRVAFEGDPPAGSTVRLQCFLAVQGGEGVTIGTICDPDGDPDPCPTGQNPAGTDALSCSIVSRSCGVPCASDLDCRGAGLIGFVCDTRELGVVDPDLFSGDTTPYNFCVNPTCG